MINLVLLVTWFTIRFIIRKKNFLFKIIWLVDITFLLYAVSVFGMYILSMPYAEAIRLDGFDRYMSSVVILDLFIGAMALAIAIDQSFFEQRFEKRDLRSFSSIITKNLYQMSAFLLLIFSIIMMYSESNGIKFTNHISQNELPVQLTRISRPQTKLNQKKVLLVDPHPEDVDSYYAGYVGRYYFTNKLIAQENFMMSAPTFKRTVAKYDYVAIPEFHSTFSAMTRQVYHQRLRTGLFQVTDQQLIRIR